MEEWLKKEKGKNGRKKQKKVMKKMLEEIWKIKRCNKQTAGWRKW